MALTSRKTTELPINPAEPIGHWQFGSTAIQLYVGLEYTVRHAERGLSDQDVVKAYRILTGDQRLTFNMYRARQVVLGDIQRMWYEARGVATPAKVVAEQERRMAKAKAAAPEAEGGESGTATAAKEPRVTNRSIIEAGLLAGTPDEEILRQVKERFPEGKADSKHIGYYRHFLIKDGKMPAPEKKQKAEKPAKGKKTSEEALKEAAVENGDAGEVAVPAKAAAPAPAKAATKAPQASSGGKKVRA